VAQDVAQLDEIPLLHPGSDIRADFAQAIEQLRQARRNYAFVVASDGKYVGTVSLDSMSLSLESGQQTLASALLDGIDPVPQTMNLRDLIGRIVQQPLPLPVLNAAGNYLGAVTQTILLKKMVEQEVGDE
jgi:glycine betaine/proline transport system ATP-binding protein